MLRKIGYFYLFLFVGLIDLSAKPNVVLFLVDDLGWSDLCRNGSTFYETPNIDQLAAEGAFFTDAYAASPVCSPTRASILTGKYPSRIGLTNHSGVQGPRGAGFPLIAPEIVGNMPLEDTTLAEVLQLSGYTTGHFGKWHLQSHHEAGRAHYPEANGFNHNVAGHKAGHPNSFYFPYQGKRHPVYDVPDLTDGEEGDYLTDVLTDKVIEFIDANKDRPFFVNFWFYTVHTPIQGRKDKVEKYRNKAKKLGLDPASRPTLIKDYQSHTVARQEDPHYAAMVESLDENVGRVLSRLKELGLDEDTIVVFLSDNGGLSTGAGKSYPTSNLPLRAGKGWIYEGGIRTPLIIKYPRSIEARLNLEEPVISTDIFPTILDLIGEPLMPEQHVDGVSLKPLLTRTADSLSRAAIFFHYPHYHPVNSMGPSGAVRAGDYKLIERYETGELSLYNVRTDYGERTDLSESMPERTLQLSRKLQEWRECSGAQMPAKNPFYDPTQDKRL